MDKEKVQEIEIRIREVENLISEFPIFKFDEEKKFEDYKNNISEKLSAIQNDLNQEKPVKGSSIVLERMVNRLDRAHMQLYLKNIDNNLVMSKLEMNTLVSDTNAMITTKIGEINKEVSYFDKIARNVYNLFGITVGLLAFIFVNFRLVSSASSLSLGKMVIYLGLSNIVLIVGIMVILNFLAFFFNGQKLIKSKMLVIIGVFAVFLSSTIIFAGERIYLKEVKAEKDTENEVVDRQEKLLKNMDAKLSSMNEKIDMLIKENIEKELKIEELQKEVNQITNYSK